jgi:hypothetical protein
MKLFVLVPLVLLGCIKEHSVKAQMKMAADGVIIPSEEYLLQLYDAQDIMIGLIANANFGEYSNVDNDARIDMSVAAIADIDLVLSDQEFHFKRDQNVSNSGPHLLTLFGKVHDMSIRIEGEMAKYRFYIPELVTADVSNADGGVKRTGSILHWNPDSQYPTKVLFAYILYDDSPMYGEMLYRDAVIVDDNGELDLSQFLNNHDAKCIEFSIYRVNAIEINTEGKKIALAFTTVDHHIYSIKD